jgi:hypothetical protein
MLTLPHKTPSGTRGESAFTPEVAMAAGQRDSFSPYYDASLLFHHLQALGICRDQLETDDPLLFRELQGRCALCRSKVRCAEERASTENLISPQCWEMYCPNAQTLHILGALQNCGRAAQYLSWPRSAG